MSESSLYDKFLGSLEFPHTIDVIDNAHQKRSYSLDSQDFSDYIYREAINVLTYDRHRAYGQHAIDYLEYEFIDGHNYITNGNKGFAIYTFGVLQVATEVMNSNFPVINAPLKTIIYPNDLYLWDDGPALARGVLGIITQHNSIIKAQQPHNFILDLTWQNSLIINERATSRDEKSETKIYLSPKFTQDGYANYRSLSVFETLKNIFIHKLSLKH